MNDNDVFDEIKDKKIAIYGGSFNPIHIGHLITGLDVIENLFYDIIVYIPANIPTHKDFVDSANADNRLKMVELAVSGIDCFKFSDIEIKRGGLTYTIDTVKELLSRYNFMYKLGIIIGDDLIDTLPKWKGIDELCKLIDFLCLARNTDITVDSEFFLNSVRNRKVEISSTEIRKRVQNSLPIDFMVTEKVKKYIIENQIYLG